MAEKDKKSAVDKQKSLENTILDLVLPCTGSVSYGLFSPIVTTPLQFASCFGSRTAFVADFLWLNAHVGIGVYIYRQDFIKKAETPWQIIYTGFCTVLFNFGSALIWGSAKTLLPDYAPLKFLFGIGSGAAILYTGHQFLDFLNTSLPPGHRLGGP